jgi:hypothetical protein
MFADVCCQSRQRALRWLRAVEHRNFQTRKEKKENPSWFSVDPFFSFLKSGPVHTATTP